MLTYIAISNFALIDHAVLTPGEGLLILTGETGAGKSILIDAIGALKGDRISKEVVRHGQLSAVVEAVFRIVPGRCPAEWLSLAAPGDADASPDGSMELILSREIMTSGKTVCRCNGRLIPLSDLRVLAASLIDIHGQHDQQAIFQTSLHLQLLDRFGGSAVASSLESYQGLWQELQDVFRQIHFLGQDPAERARLLDMLQYQVREIEQASVRPGEDETLTQRRRVAANSARIREALGQSFDWLSGDSPDTVLSQLSRITHSLESVGRHMPQLDKALEPIRDALFTLQNTASDLRAMLDTVDADPAELERIDERLDQLFRLKKKYGGTLDDVQRFHADASEKLQRLQSGEARYEQLMSRQHELSSALKERGEKLTAARKYAATRLETQIVAELAELGMKGVRFAVSFLSGDEQQAAFERNGMDKVEFLFSANPGEPLKPLARIASGGEASRIMLAIKSILAEADQTPVLIFDEIDSGVSGQTAGRVAEKLQRISRGRQVFCITHLAQIAAMADRHLLVEKQQEAGRSSIRLSWLDAQEAEAELARLLSGGVGAEAARALASQLLKKASQVRRDVGFPGIGTIATSGSLPAEER